jgi:hypothetical protein
MHYKTTLKYNCKLQHVGTTKSSLWNLSKNSQDGVVRYFNLKEATGYKLLTNLEKGRYAETDFYVTHEDIGADRGSVLMVGKLFAGFGNMCL